MESVNPNAVSFVSHVNFRAAGFVHTNNVQTLVMKSVIVNPATFPARKSWIVDTLVLAYVENHVQSYVVIVMPPN